MTARDGSGILKRSVAIAGHRTSVSLEAPFWEALATLARERGLSVQACIAEIDGRRGASNLSSAIRVDILAAVMAKAAPIADPSTGSAARA